ncbi:MAG: methylglyoxal synthase [Clostridiales bacterium]|nr:methylglyoxal synthase [Clostridiales bacterium]
MNIALLADENKQELMVQFCIAYCGILAKHTICATNTTGRMVAEATGLDIKLCLSHEHGGSQQIGARISYNEIDMVLFFTGPKNDDYVDDLKYICHLCDIGNVPVATNIATAEMLIMGLNRGDLDYREILYPRNKQVIV